VKGQAASTLFISGLFFLPFFFVSPPVLAEETSPQTVAGVSYGWILELSRDSLLIKPLDRTLSTRRFFVDSATEYYVNSRQKSYADLYFGDKVAVSFFGDGKVFVADRVFVVFGEFDPQGYLTRPTPQPQAEGSGKKKKAKTRRKH
jgi:hypothetical protein